MQGVVERNSSLLSAGVRDAHGHLKVEAGDHSEHWTSLEEERSSETQMLVPIYRSANERWGAIELRFPPERQPGLWGQLQAMDMGLMIFVSSLCFFAFNFILRLVLKHLDPSKAVPRRVRDALDNLAEGLMILDTRYNILLANTALATVCGQDADELVGKGSASLPFQLCGEEDDSGEMPWNTALSERRVISNQRIQLQDSKEIFRTYLVNCSPLLGHNGRYCGVMVTFDDITLLEESRLQLSEARDAADAANQAKSDFLANMSHEIRTPMNAILGFTDVLRRGMEENPHQRMEYLNTIHSSGNHLIELINDILDLSKVEAGKLDLEIREFSLPRLLHETTHVLSAKAQQQGIDLNYQVIETIPEMIQSDSTRLKQVLINLVSNAIKFTEVGRVVLQCRSAGDFLQFDVVDTGVGMTPEQQQKIFDPFSQADSSVTRRYGGTGLGLSICKRFVEALGGSISVTSEIGQGSTFTVRLPVATDGTQNWMDHQACVQSVSESDRAMVAQLHRQFQPAKILVVDDGKTNRGLVAVIARRHGLEVLEADNGAVGIEIAEREQIDLILMDMQMPVLDGYTATKRLRESGCRIPIIALTGNAMQGDRQRCLDIGCDGYLTKPIEIDQLIDTLGQHLPFSSEVIPAVTNYQTTSDTTQFTGQFTGESQTGSTNSSTESYSEMEYVEPWGSTLPMDDPEFRQIVEKFVELLPEKLQRMIDALKSEDFQALSDLGHWLKGSGGTVGLGRLTAPSQLLEAAAMRGDSEKSTEVLQSIIALSAAIDLNAESMAS